jgi:D-alanyl-D-alanine carboxypeptidase
MHRWGTSRRLRYGCVTVTGPHRAVARSVTAVVIAVALAVTVVSDTVGAQSLQELRNRQEEIRQEQAAQAKKVDAAQAEYDVLADALRVVEENVAAQEAKVRSAEQALAAAEDLVRATDDRIAAVLAEAEGVREDMRALAVQMYVGRDASGTTADVLFGVADPLEAARRRVLLDARIGSNRDFVDELRRVNQDLEFLKAEREDAMRVAEEKRRVLDDELAVLEQELAAQAALVAEAELRVERMMTEAAGLEQQHAEIAATIRQKEQEIAAALEAARARARQQAASGGGGGGRGGGGRALPVTGMGDTVVVGGIRVHSSIAGAVQSLLGAAANAGLSLGGGGWRSSDGQVSLRRSNCGSSDYAVYEMPPGDCRPPTARPGASMHERGLAIDFSCNGALVSRGSECYQWLAANAPGYGLYNLPSEPWHWSTNGQ